MSIITSFKKSTSVLNQKKMNNTTISLTEGLLIIEFPGRGVSLRREGKSHTKCGRRNNKAYFLDGSFRPTVMRHGGEITREIVSSCKPAHQIVKINEQLVKWWATTPMPDELVRTTDGKKFKPKYSTKQRFQMRLKEHFECICIAANINPERCSWIYKND